jgi:Rrf2 family protein
MLMKISTKGRYAVDIMLDMALNNTGEYITLKTIAERLGLSGKYLEQIISILNKAGYVRSIRGYQGGYKLAMPPEQYTLGMILRLMEGSLSPVACLENEVNICPNRQYCVTIKAWKQLDDAIKNTVDKITLADLTKWQRVYEKQRRETARNPEEPLQPVRCIIN